MSTAPLSPDDANSADGEGVWSPEIEQAFQEALLLFPACGRRKHILQEEGGGKMYGRNELIARHIMMRTGKSRTRKQVSSHIQVLARRKAKTEAGGSHGGSHGSSQGSSTSATPSPSGNMRPQPQIQLPPVKRQEEPSNGYYGAWLDRPIATTRIRLVEFSAFIEYRNFSPTLTNTSGVLFNGNPIIHHQQHQQNASSVNSTISISSPTSTTSFAALDANHLANTNSTDSSSNLDVGLLQPVPSHMQPYASSVAPSAVPPMPIQTYQSTAAAATHPLTSNHHLPAQFNQASSFQANINQTNGQLNIHQHQTGLSQAQQLTAANNGLNGQQFLSSSRSARHSYVRIDYTQTLGRQTNKLERIDINQIQDKFPEIGGLDGLFQRGPADSFFLVKFWADLNNDYEYNIEDQNSYFGFSSHFETIDPYKTITCSTKACSYGMQVVEKVDKIYGVFNSSNGRYSYDINRSPMCEFMIHFIKKLRQLPRTSQMNSVLENFTVLQVITSESTSEILLCLAYVFEVAPSEQNNGPQYNVYKLTKDWTIN